MSQYMQEFHTRVQVLFAAAHQKLPIVAEKLRLVDAMGATEDQQVLWQSVKETSLQHMALDPDDFAVLYTPASHASWFFCALTEALLKAFIVLTPAMVLAVIELARRQKNYDRMAKFAGVAKVSLVGQHPEVWKARAKVEYELHMAAYQQAQEATGEQRTDLLNESLRLALVSQSCALHAGDKIGELFALMNVSGLIYPALGKNEEALKESAQVQKDAESHLVTTKDAVIIDKLQQIVMNVLLHRLRIGTLLTLALEIPRWLEQLESNPEYQKRKGEAHIVKIVNEARAALVPKD